MSARVNGVGRVRCGMWEVKVVVGGLFQSIEPSEGRDEAASAGPLAVVEEACAGPAAEVEETSAGPQTV